MTIRWQTEAVEEVDAIAAFYQAIQPGLEQRFFRGIGRCPTANRPTSSYVSNDRE